MNAPKNIAIALTAAISLMTFSAPAFADVTKSSIEYHGGKKKYDRKIEAAAIRRAAEKIGDLRGSLEGNLETYIVDEKALEERQSSYLGFPIMRTANPDRTSVTGSLPIL